MTSICDNSRSTARVTRSTSAIPAAGGGSFTRSTAVRPRTCRLAIAACAASSCGSTATGSGPTSTLLVASVCLRFLTAAARLTAASRFRVLGDFGFADFFFADFLATRFRAAFFAGDFFAADIDTRLPAAGLATGLAERGVGIVRKTQCSSFRDTRLRVDPESRRYSVQATVLIRLDSGFIAARCPGMTTYLRCGRTQTR